MRTILHYACCHNDIECAKEALDKGVDVNAKDSYECTALFLAIEKYGRMALVSLLLENGANIEAKNNSTWTSLMKAAHKGNKEVVSLLLEKGADVNAKTDYGRTALMAASNQGKTEIVSMLLEKGADVNMNDHNGTTALMEASAYGHTEIVSMLVEKGADVNAKDKDGSTAIIVAILYRKKHIATLIKKHIHDKLMEEVLNTTLIVKKGLRQKRDGLLVPYAQKEIIHRIVSFFYIKTSV